MKFKRLFDIYFSIIFLFLFIIPMIIIAIIIKITSKGPFIHWSRRIGLDNKEFMMPKFRTMTVNTPQISTDKLKNPSKYLTKIGSFLRNLSLDELPQLWSILLGHMSFVGPRPALFNQYNLIKLRNENNIFILKPGLTGFAQINGRDDLSDVEKVKLDHYYKINHSNLFDLKIIFLTIHKVFLKKNVNH